MNIRKSDGSTTIKGADGKIATNVAGDAVAGPTRAAAVPAPAGKTQPQSPTPNPLRILAQDVDTRLAKLHNERLIIRRNMVTAYDQLHYAIGDRRDRTQRHGWTRDHGAAANEAETGDYNDNHPAKVALREARAQKDLLADNLAQAETLEDEFEAAGGWSRAFVVPNGHVHKSMSCSTCFPTTEFEWLTEYSGADENEIVDAAGERACTVCYPSAPVDVLSRASRIQASSEKDKAAARAERENKKAAKSAEKAAKAPCADGSELTVVTERGYRTSHHPQLGGEPYERTETFKTERAAQIWAVDKLAWDIGLKEWKGPDSGISETEHEAVQVVVEALAAKRGVDPQVVRDDFEKKAAAKHKRESR